MLIRSEEQCIIYLVESALPLNRLNRQDSATSVFYFEVFTGSSFYRYSS